MTTDYTLIIGNKNYSTWSLRPWFFMKQNELPFEEIKLALYTHQFQETVRQYSPSLKVPVLKVGGRTIWDSLAICEFLADTDPRCKGWPEDPFARGHARSISAEMHSGFSALRDQLPMDIKNTAKEVPPGTALQTEIQRVQAIWRETRQEFGQAGPWLFGRFSIADAMYAPVVFRFKNYGVQVTTSARHIWTPPCKPKQSKNG